MKDLLEAVGKYVPAQVSITLLAVAAAFWAVHYWKGFRDYGDTFRDRAFLSVVVIAAAGLFLYWVNRAPTLPISVQPIVLVPYFDGDERDQYRTALMTQLERRLEAAGKTRAVHSLPVFLAEYESAVQSAKRYGAHAVVYGAKIIREKDVVRICFHIALTASNSTKPYAMLPVEVPVLVLDEIANTLLAGSRGSATEPANPLITRLNALEQQLAELRTALQHVAPQPGDSNPPKFSGRRYAVVAGVNEIEGSGFSLQFAAADAQAIGNVLKDYGFDTTVLVGREATRARVMESLAEIDKRATEDDVVVFYYAGNATADAHRPGAVRVLRLFLADSRIGDEGGTLTINDLRAALEQIGAEQRLAILDGCHGTTGLLGVPAGGGLVTGIPSGPLLQFFAASSDDEYAMESSQAGGGVFTQALIQVLSDASQRGTRVRMSDVVTQTTSLVRAHSDGRQTPKLVTVMGAGELQWVTGDSAHPR